MRTLIFILFLCISQLGLSQNKLEMVPNGDFSKYTDYTIPAKQWKDYFGDHYIPIPLGNPYYNPDYLFQILDVYKFSHIGSRIAARMDLWLISEKAHLLLNSWYPYADSNNHKINFDSLIYEDTFNFYKCNQYVNTNFLKDHYIPFEWDAQISKLRVCGKNLGNLTAPLRIKTRARAYYNLNLNLMYDWPTYIYTMIYRGYITGTVDYADPHSIVNKYPTLRHADNVLLEKQRNGNYSFVLKDVLCNMTLDSTFYARNNNFKITLLNAFFMDPNSINTSRLEQDIWQMPLFSEIYDEKHFTHRFKANGAMGFLQIRQKHPDSVQYYAKDTMPFPQNEDSLLYVITVGGLFPEDDKRQRLGQRVASKTFHPFISRYPYVKQWQYPGKVRRYADKVLRNADYFLDNLSLKPEMYRNTPIAAPNLLCHADTFLAFIPSGENAIWTDLRTGKVLSEGDSCLIFLNDEVLIEVKGENFRYVLKYSIKIPQSPFDKPVYQLCKGDSLKFQAESGFSAYWQFGKYQSNTYTHHYADTPVLQITYKTALGCVYTYSAEVIKGPESNDFSIDTALCDQVKFHWNIPDTSWTLQAQNRVVKENNKLAISIPTDFNSEIVLIDPLSKCPITLKAQIASNTTPDLVNVQDTTLCYLDQYEVRVAPALWYTLNGTQVKQPIFIDSADRYELIAGNRNCTDTVSFTLLKYPEIEAKIEQLNPWTCYLDSPLIFSALPNKYQYYWQETKGPDSLFQQSDSLRINVMALDSHGCERNYYISPKYACFKPVWIPNVFTPNGNGPEENERFAPSCVSCQTTYMRIYNRWGEMIYSGVEPWDGTYEGKLVPNGVYAYSLGVKISYGSQRSIQHFKGNVQVLR